MTGIEEQIKENKEEDQPGRSRKHIGKKIAVPAALLGVSVVIAAITMAVLSGEEEISYKETQVIRGSLSAGITESGSVDIGTTVQKFELDISEFTGSSGFDFNAGQGLLGGFGGGMDQMSSLFSGQAQSSFAASSERALEVEEVYLEAGQEIGEGDPVLKLTEESVERIRTELEEDVSSAKLVYDQALTAGKQSDQQAEASFKTNVLYGTYAEAEYEEAVGELEDAAEQAEEDLLQIQESLLKAQTDLEEKEGLLKEEKTVLENAVYAEEHTDPESELYWWIVAYETVSQTEEMVNTLEAEIEQLKEDIETYTEQEKAKKTALLLAEKDLESGKLSAQGQLDKRNYQAENAQEIYDVSVEQSDFDIRNAEEAYVEADEKLQEFDAVIREQIFYAEGNGVVTEVFVASGDTLTREKELFYLNDYDAVTITLSIGEEDMDSVKAAEKINVILAAFPEEVFSGSVTKIGDAEIDSSTNKTLYTVTVTVENMGNLLYQDMSAEVTFVSGEAEEVLYVPDRAILQKDGASYVRVMTEEGKVTEKEVVSGFSDGINTEIREGLTEGETVLIENREKK